MKKINGLCFGGGMLNFAFLLNLLFHAQYNGLIDIAAWFFGVLFFGGMMIWNFYEAFK